MSEPDSEVQTLEDAAPRGVVWRVKVSDNVYGPYPRAKILDYIDEGRIGGHTLLALGDDGEFVRAEEHPNLRWDFSKPKPRGFNAPRLEEGESEVPVSNFFIAGRLLAGSEAFEDVLHQTGKFARAGGDMWVLRAQTTLPQLRNQLSAVMKKDEQIVIINASKDRIAWFNLGVQNDVAVRSIWDADI